MNCLTYLHIDGIGEIMCLLYHAKSHSSTLLTKTIIRNRIPESCKLGFGEENGIPQD